MTTKEERELKRRIAETISVVNNTEYVDPCKDDVWRVVNKILLGVSYIVLAVSMWSLLSYYYESYEAQGNERRIRQLYTVNQQYVNMSLPDSIIPDIVGENITPQKELVFRQEMSEFYSENPDTVGYIKIKGTGVDGVVVQGDDDEHYLDYNFWGQKRQCGTLFVDSRCTINTYADSPNIIIYGHNQADGTMFGDLDFYRWNHEFWKSQPIISFDTLYEERDYVIIASFVTNELPKDDNGNRFDYQNYIYFNDTWTFEDWSKEIMLRTQFFTGVEFTENDQYITLSTCSTEWEPSRHVIIARLLHDGEEVDVDKWEDNPNPKMPQIWYDYNGGGSWNPDN